MDFQGVLSRMAKLTSPFLSLPQTSAVLDGAATAGTALGTARQALLQELGREATRRELSATSELLLRRHEALAAKPRLTADELQQLSVLSGTALVLSAEVLGQALSEEELFTHAVTQIGPWLRRAVDCGLLRVAEMGRAMDAPLRAGAQLADALGPQPDRERSF